VAADVKNGGLAEAPDPEYYVVRRHSTDDATSQATFIIRSSASADAVEHWAQSEVEGLDPTLPVTLGTMEERLATFAARPRFDAALLGMFAASGVMLAAIGIYGVIAFLVSQRTQEIGVRMALGANRRDILRLIFSESLPLVALGSIVGVAAALAVSRVLKNLLFNVAPHDPISYVTVVLLLIIVAFVATLLPARAASKTEPMVALRVD
jgi:putative ABC transport system permease protein